jgi:hypothetical protein
MDEEQKRALAGIIDQMNVGIRINSGHAQGLIQVIAALVSTHPNKAAFSEAFARFQVFAPLPDSAPPETRNAYDAIATTVDLALRDNRSVNRGTP